MGPIKAKQQRTSVKARAQASSAALVVGYLRVSTAEQAESGLGLDSQRATIEAACSARGWTVASWAVDDGVSGSVAPADRPALSAALAALDAGEAGALVAAKVDRLARDTMDLLALAERSEKDGWALAALDLGVDTSTPMGKLLLTMLGAFAEWERQAIRQRTRDALQAKKARGARLGRPVSPATRIARERIRALHLGGASPGSIAATLNAEGLTTATGLEWGYTHVLKTLDSLRLDDAAARADRLRA